MPFVSVYWSQTLSPPCLFSLEKEKYISTTIPTFLPPELPTPTLTSYHQMHHSQYIPLPTAKHSFVPSMTTVHLDFLPFSYDAELTFALLIVTTGVTFMAMRYYTLVLFFFLLVTIEIFPCVTEFLSRLPLVK
jgi:hypothetical protein